MKKPFILPILIAITVVMTFSGCELAPDDATNTETESITESEGLTAAVTESTTESATEAVSATSANETEQTEPITEKQTEATIEAESEISVGTEYASETVAKTESETVTVAEAESGTENETESETVGISENHAPDFTVLDGNGNYVSLSDYFGKPIVLNFWASWCPPCKAEMPDFEEQYKNNPDVQFMMINCTYYDTMEDANKFLSDSGYTFPVFYDTTGIGVSTYGITGFPTTYFIASTGEVIAYKVGMLSAEELEQGLEMIK